MIEAVHAIKVRGWFVQPPQDVDVPVQQRLPRHARGNDVGAIGGRILPVESLCGRQAGVKGSLRNGREHAQTRVRYARLPQKFVLRIENRLVVMIEPDNHAGPDLHAGPLNPLHLVRDGTSGPQVVDLFRFPQRLFVRTFHTDEHRLYIRVD